MVDRSTDYAKLLLVVLFIVGLFIADCSVSDEKKCHFEERGSQNDDRKSLETITSQNTYLVGNYLKVQVLVWTHPLIDKDLILVEYSINDNKGEQ